MDVQLIAALVAGGGVLGVVVWALAKVGQVLVKVAEALVAVAVVFLAVWLMIKAVLWALRQVGIHWRTSLAVVAVLAWWHCWAGLRWSSPGPWARWACRCGDWST